MWRPGRVECGGPRRARGARTRTTLPRLYRAGCPAEALEARTADQRPMMTFARNVAPPRLVSLNVDETPVAFCPSAFGTVVHCTSPAAPIQRPIRASAPPRT